MQHTIHRSCRKYLTVKRILHCWQLKNENNCFLIPLYNCSRKESKSFFGVSHLFDDIVLSMSHSKQLKMSAIHHRYNLQGVTGMHSLSEKHVHRQASFKIHLKIGKNNTIQYNCTQCSLIKNFNVTNLFYMHCIAFMIEFVQAHSVKLDGYVEDMCI